MIAGNLIASLRRVVPFNYAPGHTAVAHFVFDFDCAAVRLVAFFNFTRFSQERQREVLPIVAFVCRERR